MKQNVAIIGAGPTGLTLARLLEIKRIEYTVFEADSIDAPNRAGGSLDIHPEAGQRALKECGLFEEFEKHARYDDQGFLICDSNGVVRLDMDEIYPPDGGDQRPEIDRAALRQILLDAIPGSRIQWSRRLDQVEQCEDESPKLRFVDGSVASDFTLVVGADGAWSKVRPILTDVTPMYSGKHYIEGRITLESPAYDMIRSTAGRGTVAALGSSRSIFTQRQGDASYRVYLGITVAEAFSRTAVDLSNADATRDLMLKDDFFGRWGEVWKTVIRHLEGFRGWPLYHLPPENVAWKPRPGFTLAGDAAHLALPNGEGVNCGMADAMSLANKLAECSQEDVHEAVLRYETEMFGRGSDTIEDGIRIFSSMFRDDNPEGFIDLLRNGLLG